MGTYSKEHIELLQSNAQLTRKAKHLEEQVGSLEDVIAEVLVELDYLKSGRKNLLTKVEVDQILKFLPSTIQHSLSIPVKIDEGGTGQSNNNTFHIGGSPLDDGTWRFSISGTDLIVERKESGSWVQKGGFTA